MWGGGSKLSEITGMEVIDMKDNEVSKSDSTHQLVACFGTVSLPSHESFSAALSSSVEVSANVPEWFSLKMLSASRVFVIQSSIRPMSSV